MKSDNLQVKEIGVRSDGTVSHASVSQVGRPDENTTKRQVNRCSEGQNDGYVKTNDK